VFELHRGLMIRPKYTSVSCSASTASKNAMASMVSSVGQ
jgi:hypothetical protein